MKRRLFIILSILFSSCGEQESPTTSMDVDYQEFISESYSVYSDAFNFTKNLDLVSSTVKESGEVIVTLRIEHISNSLALFLSNNYEQNLSLNDLLPYPIPPFTESNFLNNLDAANIIVS